MTWDVLCRAVAALPGPLVVGVSGGADSALLAAAAVAVRDDAQLVHVNHHLQPAAAPLESMARRLARALGVSLEVLHADPRVIRGGDEGIEGAARRERYGLLARAVRSLGAEHGMTAHTLDDRLETLLLRLIQGTSAAGLTGPRRSVEIEGVLWHRPMLAWSRAGVRREALMRSLPWLDDPMNEDRGRLRVALRTDVVGPLVERAVAGPHGLVPLVRSLQQLEEDGQLLGSLVREVLERLSRPYPAGTLRIDRAGLAAEPGPTVRAVLAEACRQMGVRPSRRLVASLCTMLAEGREGTLRGSGLDAVLGACSLRLSPRRALLAGEVERVLRPGEWVSWGWLRMCWIRNRAPDASRRAPRWSGVVPLPASGSGPLLLRCPMAGDRIAWREGSEMGLLERLARDGWPVLERRCAPVLQDGDALLGVVGGRWSIAARNASTDGCGGPRGVLCWTYGTGPGFLGAGPLRGGSVPLSSSDSGGGFSSPHPPVRGFR